MFIMIKVSVVVPNYNSSKTIAKTIVSLKNQSFKDFNVTIVDDGSRDNSVSIIKELIKDKKNFRLVELPENHGASNARNVGAGKSKGKIILFTDSDVVLKEDTVQKVVEFFKKNPDADAVVGLPDKKSSFHNLSSEHFNLRVHYNYINLPERINILYTSICAVKRKAFEKVKGFNTKMRSEEDPELGFRLTKAGYKIISNKELSVFHYKGISFLGLLKNDFKRSASRVKLMLREKMAKDIKNKGFISTPKNQIHSALIMPFIWLSIILGIFFPLMFAITIFLLFVFLKFYFNYLKFASKEIGFVRAFLLFLLLLIDMSIVNFGILNGLIKYFAGEHY